MTLRPFAQIALLTAAILAAPTLCAGQTLTPQDLGSLPMEELLGIEVMGASKFLQDVREAPASITIVTAEDIRRYGHRTLADVVRSVRGFYTTYDRNYMYVGMRGAARPGDYNTRLLLMIDGHRLNDGIYDMAPVGTDFPIDIAMIERVEVIRGPASSLYGTSAFFGVINVVTRTGGSRKGVQLEADHGSLDTSRAGVSYGHLFEGGQEMFVGASAYGSQGQSALFYPEFSDTDGGGTARRLDDDRASTVFGSFAAGRFSFRGSFADRRKDIPTAAYGMAFGDDRGATADRRGFVDMLYDGSFGRGWSGLVRVGYDYYGYHGDYPTDYGEEDGVVVFEDGADVRTLTAELTARRRFGRRHMLTAGTEVRRQVHNHQWGRDAIYGLQLDVEAPSTSVAAYVQDEMRLAPWLIATGGLRIDRLSSYGQHVTPRAALVVLPRGGMALKLLHGRAFRAPNAYELYYYQAMRESGRTLRPEQIVSNEVVWEQSFKQRMRATVALFKYSVDGLIEQRNNAVAAGDVDLYFANGDGLRANGVEVELESRFVNGVVASVSHTYARVRHSSSGERMSNSPSQLSKVAVQVPAGPVAVSMEGSFVGSRLTLGGERLDGFFAPNVTITSSQRRRLGFMIGFYNAFDRRYADPGAEEHTQQSIEQDGRTILARVRVAF